MKRFIIYFSACLLLFLSGCSEDYSDLQTQETPDTQLKSIPLFAVGTQFNDKKGTAQFGSEAYAFYQGTPDIIYWSDWNGDANTWDPDGVQMFLKTQTSIIQDLKGLDFRLHFQAADKVGSTEVYNVGPDVYTPWASQSSFRPSYYNINKYPGWEEAIRVTNSISHDPDVYRVGIEFSQWPSYAHKTLKDFRLWVRPIDKNNINSVFKATPWATYGGGNTGWTYDSDKLDFDAILVHLECYVVPE